MAGASLGSLVVSLGLDAVDYTTGLTKAERDAQKFVDNVTKVAAQAGALLGGAAVAGATGLVYMVKSAIDAADHLNDLSKQTGIAVDTLGGIGFAASQAGGNLDSAAAAAGKLNKSLAAAAAGNEEAAQAFQVLGISVQDTLGRTKSADQAMVEIANKFAGFADGPEKAALALRLFGKAGAEIIPLLDDGGRALQENIDYYKRFAGVTAEVAAAADQFNDTLGKINLLSGAFGRTLAAELLPGLQAVADELLRMKEEGTGTSVAVGAVKTVFDTIVITAANVAFVFQAVGREIGAIAAQLAALARMDFGGFSAISDAVKADAARARKELDAFEQRVIGQKVTIGIDHGSGPRGSSDVKPPAPRLPDKGGRDDSDAILRKQLDGRLKLIRDFANQQRDAYQFANRFVDGVFQDGIVSLQEFYDTETRIRQAGVDAQVSALNQEIAALEAYKGKVGGKDRVDAENKIADAVQRRAQIVQRAGQDNILAAQEEARATLQLRDRYEDLRASILQLQGDTAGAAKVRIDQQVRDAQRLITQAGGNPADAQRLRAGLEGQLALNEAQQDYSRLLERARDAEESLLLAAREGGATELDTLRALGAERAKTLAQLDQMARKAAEFAVQLGTPESIRFAEQLGMQFKRAAAEVDPLLLKIRDVGREMGDSIASSFEDAIVAGKGFRETLSAIEDDILRIVTRNLVTKPLGDAISGFLGGNGQSSGGGGFIGGAASFLSSLFGGGRAVGGAVEAGGMYRVNERRTPELLDVNGKQLLLMGNQRGRIDPNPQAGGGGATRNYNISVQMPAGATRETATQFGARIAQQIRIADSRNN
jgi:hypothetical protein